MKNDLLKQTKEHITKLALIKEGDNSLFLMGRILSIDEVAELRMKVKKISESNEMIPPMEKFVDMHYYNDLDDESKMRYLLELCSLFLYLKKTMIE